MKCSKCGSTDLNIKMNKDLIEIIDQESIFMPVEYTCKECGNNEEL
jgi:hypothetical protein